MCCRPTTEPLDREALSDLQETLIKSVESVMNRRGTAADFYEALTFMGLAGPEELGAVARRLDVAAHRMRDDAVRILVELMNTAAVMHALGEFPTPDEGNDADPPDVV